jgi:hypothetical protein
MERLFKQGTKDGVENTKNVDSYRYQSGRSSDGNLLANAAIRDIVTHVTKLMHEFDVNFRVVNVNILYSKANGAPQGVHMDECRTRKEIEGEGEMISAIVPLMENTSLDIFNKDHRRNRITILPTMMIIFSGDLLHGGADYNEPNARLHMYFVRGCRTALENTIQIGDICPHQECYKHKAGVIYTKMQLRDHWNLHHKVKENMTVGQYAANLEGRLLLCRYCKGYSIGNKGYTRHKKLCHERDIVLKRNVASAANNQMQVRRNGKDKEAWQSVVLKEGKSDKKEKSTSIKKIISSREDGSNGTQTNGNQAEMRNLTEEHRDQDAEVEVETNRSVKKRKK